MSQFDDPAGAMPPHGPDGAPGEVRPLDDAELEGSGDPQGFRYSDAEQGAGAGAGSYPPGGPGEAGQPFDDPHPPAPPVRQVPVPHECLHRKVIVYWLLSGLVSWVFLSGFLAGGAALVYFKWTEAWRVVLPVTLAMIGSLLVWTLISPSLAWARWRFRVDDELLLARYGILFIEEKAIPISRLQHVDLYRGLLERFFGLTTLIVFTAGTEGAHFRLPGLSVERAQQLRDQILAARGDDVI